MSRVKSKDSGPEMLVRRAFHGEGLRFRLHRRDLPGTPDLVLPKYKVVVFVHGCFWHGHPGCRRASIPATNSAFWKTKLEGNARRDLANRARLEALGWTVVTIWSCEAAPDAARNLANQIKAELPRLSSATKYDEIGV